MSLPVAGDEMRFELLPSQPFHERGLLGLCLALDAQPSLGCRSKTELLCVPNPFRSHRSAAAAPQVPTLHLQPRFGRFLTSALAWAARGGLGIISHHPGAAPAASAGPSSALKDVSVPIALHEALNLRQPC